MNELYHHGIKGQKWGVRRYQNEDGSLTSAGKNRYKISNIGNNALKKRSEVNSIIYDSTDRKLPFSKQSSNERMLSRQERWRPINKSYKKTDRVADERLFNAMHKNPKNYIGSTTATTVLKSGYQAKVYDKGGHQGRKAVRRISKRMDKGDTYETAFKKEVARQATVRAGKEIVKKYVLPAAGSALLGLAVSKYNKAHGIESIVQNHYYDPIDITSTFNKIN